MKPLEFQRHLAETIATSPILIPGVREVHLTERGVVRVDFGDNARVFATVVHAGPADRKPEAPTWPMPPTEPEVWPVTDDPGAESMRVTYFAGLASHLLGLHAEEWGIGNLVGFADLGLTGSSWPPCGIAVRFTDDTAVYVAFSAASGDGGNNTTRPDTFNLEEFQNGKVS